MPHPKAPTSTLGPPTSASALRYPLGSRASRPAFPRFPSVSKNPRPKLLKSQKPKSQRPGGTPAIPGHGLLNSSRPGFTLIELLVVIGILVVLAGIGYGAILSTRRQEAHRAVTALVSDFIRQARHTAMSSGAPVEVHISGATVGHIQGFTQVVIVGEQCESFPSERVPGFAGYGAPIGRKNPNDPVSSDSFGPWEIPTSSTRPMHILLKSSQDPNILSSFYMECLICPLPVNWKDVNWTVFDPVKVRPLIALALREGSGQELVTLAIEPPTLTGSPLVDSNSSGIRNWDPCVYYSTTGGMVSLFPPNSQSATIATGSWTRLGVLWREEQNSLELFADGRGIARISGVNIPTTFTNLNLCIGDPTNQTIAAGIVDNVRLLRLGGGEGTNFPGGFVPNREYRLIFNPDGILNPDAPLTSQTLIFTSDRTGKTETITITVEPTGTIHSTITVSP